MRVHTSIHDYLSTCLMAVLCLTAAGCSQQPQVDTNTPEYLFSQVKNSIADSRYDKAIDWITDLQAQFPKSEQAEKARLLKIIILAGMSDGYRNIAAAYLSGMEAAPERYGKLRSTAFNYHRKRKSVALSLYQACDRFLKRHSPESAYALESSWPADASAPSSEQLDQVKIGRLLDSEEQQQVEAVEVPMGVGRTLATFLGAEEDQALARKTLEQGSVDLVPSQLLLTVAQCLLDNQKLFGREGLSEFKNYSLFLREAAESLNLALATLQDRPDEAIQAKAEQLKEEIQAMFGTKTKSSG